MNKTRKDPNTLILGDWNVICPVCSWKWKASDMVRRWDGVMVCPRDVDPYHPRDLERGVQEKQTVPFAYPEADDQFVEVTQVTENDWDQFPHSIS